MVNGPPVTDNYKLHDENVDVFDLCLRLIEVSMCRTLGEIDKTEVRLFAVILVKSVVSKEIH